MYAAVPRPTPDHRPAAAERVAYSLAAVPAALSNVMETRPSPALPAVTAESATTPADDLPGLYRDILDRVAALEQIGEREHAARIRMAATKAYSEAWNESGRGRLIGLISRADRMIAGHDRPGGWTLRRRSAPAR